MIGKAAPDFELHIADGQTVRLRDLRGKTVLLDFWATWCGACLEEIPIIEKLQVEAKPSEVLILGISDEDAPVVRQWLEENHRSFRTLVEGKKTFEDFGVKPIPAIVVIDARGIITKYVVGFNSERQLRESVGNAVH